VVILVDIHGLHVVINLDTHYNIVKWTHMVTCSIVNTDG